MITWKEESDFASKIGRKLTYLIFGMDIEKIAYCYYNNKKVAKMYLVDGKWIGEFIEGSYTMLVGPSEDKEQIKRLVEYGVLNDLVY